MEIKTKFSPEEAGYDPLRIEAIDKHFSRLVTEDKSQGTAYCLSRNGKTFAYRAVGRMHYDPDADDKREMRPDIDFGFASMTKMFTATSIFKLVEDGYIRLDQPVGDILPEFSKGPYKDINIAHLLTHTSGLQPDEGTFDNPYFLSEWELIEQGFRKGKENWIESSMGAGLRKKPGEEWAYCSFGFVLLGEIISRVSTVRVEKFIEQEILNPCEMKDTYFFTEIGDKMKAIAGTPEYAEKVERIVIVNEHTDKIVKALRANVDISQYKDPNESDLWKLVPETGGGLRGTVLDVTKFGNMFLNDGYYNGKRILGRKAIEKMTRRYTTSDVKDYCWNAGGVERSYALGPDTRNNLASLYSQKAFFHEGAGSSCMIIDPEENMVAAWAVPYTHEKWYADGLYNASAVMWSGIK